MIMIMKMKRLLFACSISLLASFSAQAEFINFNDAIESFGGSQDAGGLGFASVDGYTLTLQGNTWKTVIGNHTVTENTVLQFEFMSTGQGEVQGIGFDNDNEISDDFMFRVYGTQNWGITTTDYYNANDGWKAYTINVGEYYTGNFTKLVFAMDYDASTSGFSPNSNFRNVQVQNQEVSVVSSPVSGAILTLGLASLLTRRFKLKL
jgi:hypothetical protein